MKMMTMNFCRSRQPGVEYSTTVDWAGDVLAALEAGGPDAVCLKWGSGLTISDIQASKHPKWCCMQSGYYAATINDSSLDV